MPDTPGTLRHSSSMPAESISNTQTRAPSLLRRSTRSRPIPRAPPVTSTVLPSGSMRDQHPVLSQNSLDLSHTLDFDDVLQRKLDGKRFFEREDKLHMLQ